MGKRKRTLTREKALDENPVGSSGKGNTFAPPWIIYIGKHMGNVWEHQKMLTKQMGDTANRSTCSGKRETNLRFREKCIGKRLGSPHSRR